MPASKTKATRSKPPVQNSKKPTQTRFSRHVPRVTAAEIARFMLRPIVEEFDQYAAALGRPAGYAIEVPFPDFIDEIAEALQEALAMVVMKTIPPMA
jgi:hypothetical protein